MKDVTAAESQVASGQQEQRGGLEGEQEVYSPDRCSSGCCYSGFKPKVGEAAGHLAQHFVKNIQG